METFPSTAYRRYSMSENEPLKNHSYSYPTTSLRAQPLKVVDGDTADLFVDLGFRAYRVDRFRFLDIDTPELNDEDEENRTKAKEAKEVVQSLLGCSEKTTKVDLAHWPLRIETAKNPDGFGRWLARIYFTTRGDIEVSVNAELLAAGLAVPYEK
jgi:micrococcal nuclease